MKYLAIILLVTLTGCATIEGEVKSITDKICAMSDTEKTLLAEKFDSITAPNKIRVECN